MPRKKADPTPTPTAAPRKDRSAVQRAVYDAMKGGGRIETWRLGRDFVTAAFDKDGRVVATPDYKFVEGLFLSGEAKLTATLLPPNEPDPLQSDLLDPTSAAPDALPKFPGLDV